ncbi:hypothetical protein H6F67_05350 [Microcoleus sp. FACHB-1515]|uniref:hypothetical protein n=1 Tax=Cyanophyceae TaxID=3028117 RepID=UPI001681CE4F|nr:hypothetical protein [Microcoleus sp. FACHB-1515]MBD2089276.1 hypothetical protein [Microcoleus sp. FACHB-1515]
MVAALEQKTTDQLKQELLELVRDRDSQPLGKKVAFAKTELMPWFEELSRRNPFPNAIDQIDLVVGVWSPVWSTIPFQDTFPGRIYEQSYQIFANNGYYANMARYAPGSKLPFLKQFTEKLVAYDFMILQRFEVQNNQWFIQNVGIQQGFRVNLAPLTIEKAQAWFESAVKKLANRPVKPDFEKLDQSTAKKYEKIFEATPQLEHLYIDRDFRLVKTQREAKQRPSYTIAVRKR